MNKILLYIIAVVCTISSCAKLPQAGENKPDDKLTLKISQENITLNIQETEETAVTFTWTTGTNYGTGKAILYSLNFAKSDGTYNDELSIDLGKHLYSMTYTVEELNNLLLEIIPLTEAGTEISFKAQVTARVPDEDRVQTAELTFTVKTYRPAPEKMFISGASADSEENLEMLKAENNRFVWQGNLIAGTLSVINDEYGISITDDIEQDGRYSVIADMTNETITVEEDNCIYFVSEESGWSFTPMTETTGGVYTIICDYKSGQFKFGTIENIWHYMYVSSESDNAPWDSKGTIFQENSASATDWKWFIWNSEPMPYEITLDTNKPEMIMKPFYTSISMIGSATAGEWSLDKKTKLNRTEVMNFIWTGELKAGELKFCCGDSPEYGKGEWFMPKEENQEFSSMENAEIQLVNAAEEGAIDWKWSVKTDGKYSISLNQYTHKLTIEKIDETDNN